MPGMKMTTIPEKELEKDSAYVIEPLSFESREDLEYVVIREGVTEIGDYAFENCRNLKRIELPRTLVKIGKNPFRDCAELEELRFIFGNERFAEFNSMLIDKNDRRQIFYPQKQKYRSDPEHLSRGIRIIGEYAFANCDLHYLSLSPGLEEIRDYAFSNVTLRSLTIPGTVRRIGKHAFSGDNQLMELRLLEGIREIDDNAFENCSRLEEISVPNSVEKIGKDLFRGCSKLMKIRIDLDHPRLCVKDDVLCSREDNSAGAMDRIDFRHVDQIPDAFYEKTNQLVDRGDADLLVGPRQFTVDGTEYTISLSEQTLHFLKIRLGYEGPDVSGNMDVFYESAKLVEEAIRKYPNDDPEMKWNDAFPRDPGRLIPWEHGDYPVDGISYGFEEGTIETLTLTTGEFVKVTLVVMEMIRRMLEEPETQRKLIGYLQDDQGIVKSAVLYTLPYVNMRRGIRQLYLTVRRGHLLVVSERLTNKYLSCRYWPETEKDLVVKTDLFS